MIKQRNAKKRSIAVMIVALMITPPLWAATLGIIVSPKGQFNHQNVTEAFNLANQAGAQITRYYFSWTGVEIENEVYDWRGTDYMVGRARQAGLRLSVAFQVIRTAIKEPRPADLESRDWEDPELIERFSNLVLTFLDRSSDIVDYVEIGSEVNSYLQYHQEDIEPFRAFYSAVYDNIKAEYPNVSVGTVFNYRALKDTDSFAIYERLNIGDYDGFTLYIYGANFAHTAHPEQVLVQLNEIAILTGDRQFAIDELGWTAATSLSGSASDQRMAVKYLFDFLALAPDRLKFINWFTLHDIAEAECNRIAGTFGIPAEYMELFSDFLCNFGLRENDGTPRPAWNEWVERAFILGE